VTKARVAVTGMHMVSGAGATVEENVRHFLDPRNHFSAIQRFNSQDFPVKFASEMPKVDFSKLPDRKSEKVLNERDGACISAALFSLKDAKLNDVAIDPERLGLFTAVGNTQLGDLAPYFSAVSACVNPAEGVFDSRKFGREMMGSLNPMVVMKTLLNNALCFGSRFADARGPNSNYFDFETSAARALYEARCAILGGRCDVAVVSSASATVEPFWLKEWYDMGYFRGHGFDGVDPYRNGEDGAIMAEAAASVVLEPLEKAQARGANVLGILDYVDLASSGAFPQTPEGLKKTTKEMMRNLFKETPASLQEIYLAANGRKQFDQAELGAVQDALLESKSTAKLQAPKKYFGETFEASMMVGLILGIEKMRRQSQDAPQADSVVSTEQTSFAVIGHNLAGSLAGIVCSNC